jgi:hypothetical protein|tara:strand:- start:1024 stop:1686 length:663 start_codon:yes stop_codon:yes gene_type:complete
MNSIDNLKATIAKKGGLAMQNRFQIFFTPPTANSVKSLLNQDIGSLIGDLAKNAISGGSAKNLIPDPRDISILCEAVSFPGRQISTIDYIAERQGIKVPYSVINEDVSMTFLLTNDYFIKKMFDAWSTGIFDVEKYRAGYKKDFVTDIVIQQLDQNNVPVYSVRLEGAFPTTISAINLDNNSENTIQKMTVTMSYENYIPEGLVDTAFSTASVALNSLLG